MIYLFGHNISLLRRSSSRIIAALLAFIMATVTTYLVPSMACAHDSPPPPPTVLVFPFTNASTITSDSSAALLTTDIQANVRLDINALGYYHATGFSVLNPSLQRALNVENTIALADLAAPTATPDRAQKLAQIIGSPYFLVGNIDTVSTDPTSGTVSVAVDGTFYQTDTGAVIKQANVTGTAAPASKDFDPDQLQSSAIANASGQLVAALVGPRYTHRMSEGTAVPKVHTSSDYGKGLLYILAISLALVIINNHGGHSSGGSSASSSTTTSTTGGTTGTSGGPPAPP